MTVMPPPDDELTPLEDWSPLDEELDVLDEVEVLEVVELAVWVEEEEEELSPGIVAALTALKTPTPATAANAAPVVSRWSRLRAASRARTRSDVWLVRSMVKSLGKPSRPYI